ncbi:MAG: PepSY-like domain-containing protein [Chitinophagales bacterium]|nr:PepSY-like domain-containing protein [Chitinophagales bacterium]
MKKLIPIFTILLLAACAEGQKLKESAVPAPVVASFNKMYPNAEENKWSMEEGNYEAEFEMNESEASVTFDAAGNLLETEKEIAVKDLPAACAAYVSKNYAGQTIKEASEITDSKGVKTYEAELKGKDLVFDANGNFINEEKD